MTNARDKANIPSLNFSSTGIDDNATETTITIDSDERVKIVSGSPTQTASTLTLKDDVASGTGSKPRLGFQDSGNTYLGEIGHISSSTNDLYLNNIQNANLIFSTNNTEKMRITSAGNVGILNSAPTTPLEVNGVVRVNEASGVSNGTIIIDALATGNPNLAFQQAGTYKGYIHYLDSSDTICLNDGSGNGLHYSPTLKRLGIDTNAPQFPLEINGHTLVNGNLIVTGGTDSAERRASITHDGSSMILKASGNSTNKNIIFHKSGDGSGDETMRINSDGAVSIASSNVTQNAHLNVRQDSNHAIRTYLSATVSSGALSAIKFVRAIPAVSAGTQLIIPFISQNNINSKTYVHVRGLSCESNTKDPKAFDCKFAVGHTSTLSNLTVLQNLGKCTGASISGMNIVLAFNTDYTHSGDSGMFIELDYIAHHQDASINLSGIVMN